MLDDDLNGMKYITLVLKSLVIEVFIIFIYIFLINNYIGNVDTTIKSDGVGYYDFLPSLFIHHDFVRKGDPVQKNPVLYERINTLPLYVNHNDYKVNKCLCGTAVLQFPFFTYTCLTTAREANFNDGYQLPFQKAVFYAAIFYLFLTIFFLKKILELYDIKKYAIIFSQLLLVLATAVTNYTNYDAGYSHVYSLFAITAFIYFVGSYFKNRNLNHFILACLFLGLILLLRQINVLIILFVPFLAGSIENLRKGFIHLFFNYKKTLIGVFLFFIVCFTQCLVWYLQTGTFLLYSYQGESFNFKTPQIFNILFSYRKGLFVYTPILFISLLGLIWLAYKRKYYLFFSWLCFFSILTYVLSSWWSWWYGCSYGLRAYIDFYAVFFILFAIMLDGITKGMKFLVIGLSLLTIPVNIIQTYQYKEYILNWINMDKGKYWKVFLKTNDKYRGLVWKNDYNYSNYSTAKEVLIGNISASKSTDKLIYSINSRNIPGFEKVNVIQVAIDNDYDRQNDTKIGLYIDESGGNHNYYWNELYFIRFVEKNFSEWQTGLYNFEITPITDSKEKVIALAVKSGNQNNVLKNVRLKFLCNK